MYGCIECGLIWCNKSDYTNINKLDMDILFTQEVSHGICPECFQSQKADKVHNHQRKNGYSECYNSSDNCTNFDCLFWSTCGSVVIDNWKSRIVVISDGKKDE